MGKITSHTPMKTVCFYVPYQYTHLILQSFLLYHKTTANMTETHWNL